MKIFSKWLDGLDDRIEALRLRWVGNIDLLIVLHGKGSIFYPISRHAREVVPKILTNSPKQMGGFFVPSAEVCEISDQIFHSDCPLIAHRVDISLWISIHY